MQLYGLVDICFLFCNVLASVRRPILMHMVVHVLQIFLSNISFICNLTILIIPSRISVIVITEIYLETEVCFISNSCDSMLLDEVKSC
jgi:hypothetical protein